MRRPVLGERVAVRNQRSVPRVEPQGGLPVPGRVPRGAKPRVLPIGVPSGRRLRGEQTVQRGRGVHESLPPARRVRVQCAMQGGQQEGAVLLSARPLWKPSDQLQER